VVIKKRVTILAVRFGNGHWKAAQVLKSAIEKAYPETQVEVLNYLVFAGWLFDKLTRLGYHDLMIRRPRLYRRFFAYTNRLKRSSIVQKMINITGAAAFLIYYRRTRPDLLICTFPVPAAVISSLKDRHLIDCPQVTVVTDYSLHQQWIQPNTDHYFVASDFMVDAMVRRHVAEELVTASGIPVDPVMAAGLSERNRQLTLLPHICTALPMVLVLNGATDFSGDLGRICGMLAEFPVPLVAVVLAVIHPQQRLTLRQLVHRGQNRVYINGFSQQVAEYMNVATCMICKAGGITISEALVKELPMLIYRPLPCQEEKNRDYLVHQGAALAASNMSELGENLRMLLLRPEMHQDMKKAAARLKKPDAAATIAACLQTYLGE
jgi:processive 1,2-diacylglycerol beta-glucosyltransferase